MKFRTKTLLSMVLSIMLLYIGGAVMAVVPEVVPGEVIVGLKNSVSASTYSRTYSAIGSVVGYHQTLNVQRLRLGNGVSIDGAIQALRRDPNVAYVEPNYVRRAYATPNDPSYNLQYHLPRIAADTAWDIWAPQTQVIVAVIDTGVDYTHPDLSGVLLRDGSNNVIGYNVFSPTAQAIDDHGHGTHASGIAVAQVNNGVGVAGVAGYNAGTKIRLMPLKALSASGSGADSGIATCIIWAVDHGANVISMSLGGPGSSTAMSDACAYAWAHNVVVVAAAGNDGSSVMSYPAACANVISVAASDAYDKLTSFSNYGTWVKVAAPGLQIYSTTMGGSYGYMSGTSMACPVVAGEAALIIGQNPTLSNADVSAIITGQVDPYTPYAAGHTLVSGAGRINVHDALVAAGSSGPVLSSITVSPSSVAGGSSATGTVYIGQSAPSGGITVALSSNNSAATVPANVTIAQGATSATFTISTTFSTTSATATITASADGISKKGTLSITSPVLSSVTAASKTLMVGATTTGTITLTTVAPTGGATIPVTSSNSAVSVPASVTVAAGSKTGTFTITAGSVTASTTATISATCGGATKTLGIVVTPKLSLLSVKPAAVVGGVKAAGTVTLSGLAPTGGVTVSISSNNSNATVPSSVTVLAGAKTASFDITTSPVSSDASATITASCESVSATSALTVQKPTISAIAISPNRAVPGQSLSGKVTITGTAPTGGITVALASSSSAVTVPTSVTIAAGANYATFTATSGAVSSSTAVTITASQGSLSKVATVTVLPFLANMTLKAVTVASACNVDGAITLNGPAPTGGISVALSSSANVVTVPATVTVAAGATSATFTLTGKTVTASTPVTITAASGGVTKTANLTVNPLLANLTVSPASVIGGTGLTGTITLNGPAPSGLSVDIATSGAVTAPATVSFTTGAKTATFAITSAAVATNATSSVSATLAITKTVAVTVKAPTPLSAKLSATTVKGGGTITCTVTISGPAPTGGLSVALSSSASCATVPSSVTIAAGQTTGVFTITSKTVSVNTVATASVACSGITRTASLKVTP